MSASASRLHLVGGDASSTLATLGSVAGELPDWIRRLVDDDADQWINARWDRKSDTFAWSPSDRLMKGAERSTCIVELRSLRPTMKREVLTLIASDAVADNAISPSAVRTLVKAATAYDVTSVQHIPLEGISLICQALIRRWLIRLDASQADPEAEWLRDEVRVRVLTGNVWTKGSGPVLRLGEISQPWLRQLTTDSLRVKVGITSEATLSAWSAAAIRMSQILRTRADKGLNAKVLTLRVMDSLAAALKADPTMSASSVNGTLAYWSPMLTQARAQGFTDRCMLPSSFAVQSYHYVSEPVQVKQDKAFPDATFRFLLGYDDLFGPAVLDLARSIPNGDFYGEMFVVLLQLAANFGRRPDELCRLGATRVQVADNGAAELLYDNFKSGRERVWLPIDRRATETVAGWIDKLRLAFPETQLEQLAMFPRRTKNSRGTRSMNNTVLATWFREWTTLLEQAIVLGHLHGATGLSVEQLVALRIGDATHGGLQVGTVHHPLSGRASQVLVDYRADVVKRAERSINVPDVDAAPLFPATTVYGGQQSPSGRAIATTPRSTDPVRFDALGSDWLSTAGRYASGGIPGTNLGDSRIPRNEVQIRLFRHTYLQHLVDAGTNIFLVQELADHSNVQTTIDSYVRVKEEALREAVDMLDRYRVDNLGAPARNALPLTSRAALEVRTCNCTNPQVLDLGQEGCDRDRLCFGCEFFASDPSYIPEIKAEIQTCNQSLARLYAELAEDEEIREHHAAMLRHRRDGWRKMLRTLEENLASLDPVERERIETAAEIVRSFRNRMRGGINFGGSVVAGPSSVGLA